MSGREKRQNENKETTITKIAVFIFRGVQTDFGTDPVSSAMGVG
jgi:hypothetical protein